MSEPKLSERFCGDCQTDGREQAGGEWIVVCANATQGDECGSILADETEATPYVEALEARLSKMEELELTIANLQLANEEARMTIDRLSALIPREANTNAEEALAGESE